MDTKNVVNTAKKMILNTESMFRVQSIPIDSVYKNKEGS
jgi:hypothetical protein